MSAYAVAFVRSVEFGPEIVGYLERIDETLDPFGGRFLVHGGGAETVEGQRAIDAIVIEFPDRDSLRAWWTSPEYARILPLRTRHMQADIVFADGVPDGYRAAHALEK
jgi:uncharacterized protein (DUF1330 family)